MPPLELLDPGFEIQLFLVGLFSMTVVVLIIGAICWGIVMGLTLFKRIVGR